MKTIITTLATCLVTLAQAAVTTQVTTHLKLDNRTGTRIAAPSETIYYSPYYGYTDGAANVPGSCTVKADGVTLKTATEAGSVVWSPTGVGCHTLTHTAGNVTLNAAFTVLGSDVAIHDGTLATSETWSDGQVHLVTADVIVPSGKTLTIAPGAIVKFMDGTSLTVASEGNCTAKGVIFTHAHDDTAGGDTLMDGDAIKPVFCAYSINGNVIDDDATDYRYVPVVSSIPQTATWVSNRVYVVSQPITVSSGVALTIEPGTVVKFFSGASLTVASGGSCMAKGVIFTHIADDTAGGDTLMDGDETTPVSGAYSVNGNVTDDDATEYRYAPPQTLTTYVSGTVNLRGHRVYIASNSVTVASGATLTLKPGTVIKFASGCSMTVNGTLNAQGTRAAPIVFTSLKDDAWGGDTNGDGEKTYAQAGDWQRINAGGTLNFKHCGIYYCSNTSDQGAIQGTGGKVTFDNGEIAHTKYECVRMNSGSFVAHNSIFRDSSMGFGYYGGSGTYAYNCVVAECSSGCRASGKYFYNTIFYKCQTFLESTSSQCKYCVFYNPPGYGAQSAVQVGSSGNVWGDPLFVDGDNVDQTVRDYSIKSAASPCVDAGDGTVAPATDYYGSPRMDVKKIKDTGVPNGDGVCPDIGIYEVPGTAPIPLPDLAVLSVAAPATARAGEEIAVVYTVTNRGAAAATGLVRDVVKFRGAEAALGGQEVSAGEVEQAYGLAAGAAASFTARVTVPALKAGAWKALVTVNAERDIYESVTANNIGTDEGTTVVSLSSVMCGGATQVSVEGGSSSGIAVTGMPTSGGAVVLTLPTGVKAYAAVGYVPDASLNDVQAVELTDGRHALLIPAHGADETVYVTLVNTIGRAQIVSVATQATTAGLVEKREADVPVTAKGPKVTANLVLPSSIRDGRVYAAYVEYANTGDEDAELPIFTVVRTGGGATLSTTAQGAFSAEPLSLVGLAPNAPRGKLKPGEAGRVTFYLLSSGTLSLRLAEVTEKSTSVLNGFASVQDYRTGMSAAATRLCARGAGDPSFTEVLAQTLNEARGAGGAAVCGTLRHAVTRLPLAGIEMRLCSTNDMTVLDVTTSDANGRFALSCDGHLDCCLEIPSVESVVFDVYELCMDDVTDVDVRAIPYSSVSGTVFAPEGGLPVDGARIVLDDLATEKEDDYMCTSDLDGRFYFVGLSDGQYRMTAYPHAGYCLTRSGVLSVTNGMACVCDIAYSAVGVVVKGSLTERDSGAAVTNVTLVLGGADAEYACLTDEAGAFAIEGVPPGDYLFSIENSHLRLDEDEVSVVAGAGEMSVDLHAAEQCAFTALRPLGQAAHTTTFALLTGTDPAWDFDGDGVADSTADEPSWEFATPGVYAVSVTYTDTNGVRRVSADAKAVKVVEKFANVLRPGNVLITETSGVEVQSVGADRLVISGAAAAGWITPGTVIGCENGDHGGFVRRVLSGVQTESNVWTFEVEEASLEDLYESYFVTTDFTFSKQDVVKMLMKTAAPKTLASSPVITKSSNDWNWALPCNIIFDPQDGVKASLTGSISGSTTPISGSYTEYKYNGRIIKSYCSKNMFSINVKFAVEYMNALRDPKQLYKNKKPFSKWKNIQGPGITGPYGIHLSVQADFGIEAYIKGGGELETSATASAYLVEKIEKVENATRTQFIDWGSNQETTRKLTGKITAGVEGSAIIGVYASWLKVLGRVGGGVRIGANAEVSQDLSASYTTSSTVSSEGGSATGKFNGFDSHLSVNCALFAFPNVSFKWLNVQSARLYARDIASLGVEFTGKAQMGKMKIDYSGKDLTVSFRTADPKVEGEGLLKFLDGIEVGTRGHFWRFGDGDIADGRTQTHTYPRAGEYKVEVNAFCPIPASLITYEGNFERYAMQKIKVFDDKPPEPQNPVDNESLTPSKSCDPNEMDGPEGMGEQRLLKPGSLATYTVYFENKADADVPAQEVRVTNHLSEWLDWSTFEMLDFAFGNQVETGLVGKNNGEVTVAQNGTAYKVRTSVSLDGTTGTARWYLRSWDPSRSDYNYWPPDGEGLLPPNDDTHRGEGHLTYRIKVRDDAPLGVVITNSASIVFDYNDPIETDPAWWNTVGIPGVAFAADALEVDEGGNVTLSVDGGNADKAASVQVYLTYQTATAADLDLAKGQLDGTTPKGGLKFPLTLSWAAGDTESKTITIPVKTDKTVEDDETLVFQLAAEQGQELGEITTCRVLLRDGNVVVDYAAKQAKETVKTKKGVETNVLAVACCAGDGSGDVGGYTSGQGQYSKGSKVSLKATARPGWEFVGWYAGEMRNEELGIRNGVPTGEPVSRSASWNVTLTNDAEIVAVFGRVPYVAGLAAPADGGKVTGSAYCAAGKKVTLKATASKNFTFVGWYEREMRNEELGIRNGVPADEPISRLATLVIDRSAKPAKSDAKQTVITNVSESVTYYAVFQSDPEVFVTAVADDATGAELTGKGAGKFVAGTVTGMGKYAAGKKVALKATANKGYVFRGWYGVPSVAVPSVLSVPSVSSVPYVPFDDPTAVDGCELLSMAATYTLAAMPTNDVELTAAFITANLDKAHIAASVDGFALAPWVSKTETHAFATNVWAGVYLEWPVAASALSETTVKVTGLPSGLKFTDKPVTTKSTSGTGQAKVTTVVTNIPANTIYGAPIAASKTTTDKNTGMTTVTPSAVMVTVATAGKSTQTYQIDTTVDPLPERVQGTFFGGSTNAPFAGSANVTVAASGKISGKWISDGKTWTLAANCFDRYDEEYDAFVVDLAAKAGKETGRFPLVVTPDGLAKSEGGIALGWANWKVEPWKTLGKSFDKRVFAYAIKADGSFSSSDADVVSPLGDDFVGKVMLTFAANGTAKIAGEFVTGYDARKSKFTTVKVTGSSTLVPQEDGSCLVFVYLAPKGLAPHARCVEVISIMD